MMLSTHPAKHGKTNRSRPHRTKKIYAIRDKYLGVFSRLFSYCVYFDLHSCGTDAICLSCQKNIICGFTNLIGQKC